jgi:hypothetical protein
MWWGVAFRNPSRSEDESSMAFPVTDDTRGGNSMTDKRGILAGGKMNPVEVGKRALLGPANPLDWSARTGAPLGRGLDAQPPMPGCPFAPNSSDCA